MNGVWGAGLLTATVLLFSWAYGVYRRPDPAAWTQSEAIAMAISVVMTAGLAFAIANLVTYAADLGMILSELQPSDFAVIGMGTAFLAYLARRLTAPDALVEVPASKPKSPVSPAERRPRTLSDPSAAQSAGRKARLRRAA